MTLGINITDQASWHKGVSIMIESAMIPKFNLVTQNIGFYKISSILAKIMSNNIKIDTV